MRPAISTVLFRTLRPALVFLVALLAAASAGSQQPPAAPLPDLPKLLQQAHDLQKQGKLDDAIALMLQNGQDVKEAYGAESLAFSQFTEVMADFLVLKTRPSGGSSEVLTPEQVRQTLDVAAQMYRRAFAIQKKFPDTEEAQARLKRALAAIDRPLEEPAAPAEPTPAAPSEPPPAAAAAPSTPESAQAEAEAEAERRRAETEARREEEEMRQMEEARRRAQEEAEAAKREQAEAKKAEDGGGAPEEAAPEPPPPREGAAPPPPPTEVPPVPPDITPPTPEVAAPPPPPPAPAPQTGGTGTGAGARAPESEQARQARGLVSRGRAQYNRGDYEAAIASFRQALQVDPGNPDAEMWLERAQAARPRAKAAPPPQPAPSAPPPQYQTKAEYTFPDETVEGNLEKPPGNTLERFPTIESPDAVAPEQEFAVQVSLTEEQITPEAKVQQGATTAEGKVVLALPAAPEQQQWKIDVALSAPGLEFARGSNMGSVVLPRQGDSTVAIFYLRARAIPTAEKTVHVMATLWYQGSYLARIERDLLIRNPQPVAASQGAAAAGTAAAPPAATARSAAKSVVAPAAPPAAPKAATEEVAGAAIAAPQQRRAALDLGFVPPDLTVVLLGNAGDETETLIIESPHLQPAQYTVPRPRGLAEWLAAQYRQIAARSSRGMQSAGETPGAADQQSTDAFLRGFGRQLYLQFAPAPFQQAFWTLEDKLGAKFRTIQIFTDDPTLPWELMCPARADGSGERDFLGMEFSVARWHVTQDAAQLERPPQTEPLEKVVVIAPQYKGESALPGQSSELSALEQFPGYSPVEGDREALRALFQDLPRGMVHFAGHGAVAQQPGSPQFAILLEDGPLDLMTWRGLTPLRTQHHPVFFFNACEVGQSQKVANFVDGWAPAVLRAGASGYIGALWPVNDRVAALFAARFYQGMERDLAAAGGRARVSEVLTETRRQVFRETGDPTALAYVFYGDPNLAFARVH